VAGGGEGLEVAAGEACADVGSFGDDVRRRRGGGDGGPEGGIDFLGVAASLWCLVGWREREVLDGV